MIFLFQWWGMLVSRRVHHTARNAWNRSLVLHMLHRWTTRTSLKNPRQNIFQLAEQTAESGACGSHAFSRMKKVKLLVYVQISNEVIMGWFVEVGSGSL